MYQTLFKNRLLSYTYSNGIYNRKNSDRKKKFSQLSQSKFKLTSHVFSYTSNFHSNMVSTV